MSPDGMGDLTGRIGEEEQPVYSTGDHDNIGFCIGKGKRQDCPQTNAIDLADFLTGLWRR
jgi:hypothetical protein